MRAMQGKALGIGALAALLAGCGLEREVILPGDRLDVREALFGSVLAPETVSASDVAFRTPALSDVTAWTHRSGRPSHNAPHAAVSAAPTLAWSAEIGTGNTRKHRITSTPIVVGGAVFTMDSQSQVTAVSAAGGQPVWARNLTPAEERAQDASGGGLAFADGRVFATTGFGEVVAMDASSGAEVWRQTLGAPATAAPTVTGGLVYVVSRDNRAWAIDAGNGRVRWQLPGTPDVSGVVGGASPAVTDRVAVFPFGSGELVAALRQGGVRLWGSEVSGGRQGKAYANITDITADPVVVGETIYTANQSGRAVALSLSSGARLWTAREGASGPVSVAGNSVFMISDQAELIRLSAETGATIWKKELPFLRDGRARRARAIFAHYGPVLAGGALWVASDDEKLRSFDPETGALRAALDLPDGAASPVAVAGGTMYVLSRKGALHAFR